MDPRLEGLGPVPFLFTPSAAPRMQCAAYSLPFRVLATAVVFGALAWGIALWHGGKLGAGSALATWFLAALALMLYTWWCIVRSVTTLDARELHQTWIWAKRTALGELAYAKVIRVRGLEWLVAPRLYVRTLASKSAVFYASDPAMLAEFERLVTELTTFRRGG